MDLKKRSDPVIFYLFYTIVLSFVPSQMRQAGRHNVNPRTPCITSTLLTAHAPRFAALLS